MRAGVTCCDAGPAADGIAPLLLGAASGRVQLALLHVDTREVVLW